MQIKLLPTQRINDDSERIGNGRGIAIILGHGERLAIPIGLKAKKIARVVLDLLGRPNEKRVVNMDRFIQPRA
jgi:hypothetical protein